MRKCDDDKVEACRGSLFCRLALRSPPPVVRSLFTRSERRPPWVVVSTPRHNSVPGITRVGVTSPGNRSFVEGLGCYRARASAPRGSGAGRVRRRLDHGRAPSPRSIPLTGSIRTTAVPPASRGPIDTRPEWASTVRRTMVSPRPVPDALVVKNGSNACSKISSGTARSHVFDRQADVLAAFVLGPRTS